MPQFDVYRAGNVHLLDCQSDFLGGLQTRLVVPLLPFGETPQLTRLNPVLNVGGERLVMATQLASPIRAFKLRNRMASLHSEHPRLMNAFDMLLTGY